MQVQDFTVIRISPIVYNDRDIYRVIPHAATEQSNISRSCISFAYGDVHTRTHMYTPQPHTTHTFGSNNDSTQSTGIHSAVHGISQNAITLLHRFAVLPFAGLVLHRVE